jgi:hypothetical protein
MPALATIDDVTALGADPGAVTAQMLEQASARFRTEAGGNQIEVTEYAMVLTPYGGAVVLPHTPVVQIGQVRSLNDDGTPGAAITGWVFDGKQGLNVRGLGEVWVNGPAYRYEYRNVHVTWTAGYDPIPEDVRWTVAAMVKRAAEAGPSGVTSEQIGDFSRSFGSYTASGAFSMTKEERAVAARYRAARGLTMPVGQG